MKQILSGLMLLLLACSSAHAVLVSRSGGLAYYDDVLNITWLADANLADTNAFGVTGILADGTMTWNHAMQWTAAMRSASYLGVSTWRLPTTLQPDASCSYQQTTPPIASYGSGCSGSEMGHLYHLDGISRSSPGPFSNIGFSRYWSSTLWQSVNPNAWTFDFDDTGYQAPTTATNFIFAWAVASGDPFAAQAVVPIPAAVWLFGSALGVMGVMRRKISS